MENGITQPANVRIFAGAGLSGTLEWNPGFAAKWNGRYDLAQKFVDSEVLRRTEPYLPFQSGMLRDSGILGTRIGSGEVAWNAPYARFLYYGKIMVGILSRSAWAKLGERKETTGQELTFHGAPKRGAYWFERMKADHGKAIISTAGKIAGGGV